MTLWVNDNCRQHFRTRTPKGDGNSSKSLTSTPDSAISEHEPRKGTETFLLVVMIMTSYVLFQNTNPERGRKLVPSGRICITIFHFRTRTPKGDGNMLNMTIILSEYVISEHEPRKGTETPSWYVRLGRTPENFRTRTPKGDGNHRVSVSPSTKFCEFQNTNPERGRKLSSSL